MKKLFKILVFLFIAIFLILAVGFFVVTSAGFQKRMVTKSLPEGSEVERVHVTLSKIEMVGLNLRLEDGTLVNLKEFQTSFSPFSALFDNTIEMGAVTVSGLQVDLPVVLIAPSDRIEPVVEQPNGGSIRPDSEAQMIETEQSPEEGATTMDPVELLLALRNSEWLLDIESIGIEGVIVDAASSQYSFSITSPEILPGNDSVISASLELAASEPLEAGLQNFRSEVELKFAQRAQGGFEDFSIASSTNATNTSGEELLSVEQNLIIKVDPEGESAEVTVDFLLNLLEPSIFAPELQTLGALSVTGNALGLVRDNTLLLTKGEFLAKADEKDFASVNLEQSLVLGGEQEFVGQLASINLISIPIEWMKPFLPEDLVIEMEPFSAAFLIEGADSGSMLIQGARPVNVGPLTVEQGGLLLVKEVSLSLSPLVTFSPDGLIQALISDLTFSDRYGSILKGQVDVQIDPSQEISSDALAGIRADAVFDIELQELFQQPVLQGKVSILGGSANVNLSVDNSRGYPLELVTSINKLMAVSEPGSFGNYKISTQARASGSGVWETIVDIEAGRNKSTDLKVDAEVRAEVEPMEFKVEVASDSIKQRDLDVLLAAFAAPESIGTLDIEDRASSQSSVPALSSDRSRGASISMPPPWSAVDGTASVKIKSLVLESGMEIKGIEVDALISEELLKVNQLKAKLGEGSVDGVASVTYESSVENAYSLASNFELKGLEPSMIPAKTGTEIPVTGKFDASLAVEGEAVSLDAMVEAIDLDLAVRGNNGVVTAFKLGGRSRLGLLGAGLLGQGTDTPELSALADIVPSFNRINFEDFSLRITRGADKKIMIPELRFVGDMLLLEGAGSIAATNFDDIMNQALDLQLNLGGKGALARNLEILGLLSEAKEGEESEFRSWSTDVNIGGTLSKPDMSTVMAILNKPISGAISKLTGGKAPTDLLDSLLGKKSKKDKKSKDVKEKAADSQKSKADRKKEEKKDEIDMGLDLLNTVFGL